MGCVGSRVDVEAEGKQFRIRKLVASGGFSQIFLAEDVGTGEKVAIKRVNLEYGRNDAFARLFEMVCHDSSEAQRVSREVKFLTHFGDCEQILPLMAVTEELSVNTSVSMFSLVFPFCKLGSLGDELIRRRQTLSYVSQQRIIHLFRQICAAIAVLHNCRPPIAHRDLKPANLMFRDERTLQLIDFGSATECPLRIENARDSRRMLDEAAELCTMPYRAPELFVCEIGAQIDENVDIWSLGCVLYALCYFSSPFDEVHERGDSVALAVQSAKLNFSKDAPFNSTLADLIQSMIKFLPEERPSISDIMKRAAELR